MATALIAIVAIDLRLEAWSAPRWQPQLGLDLAFGTDTRLGTHLVFRSVEDIVNICSLLSGSLGIGHGDELDMH